MLLQRFAPRWSLSVDCYCSSLAANTHHAEHLLIVDDINQGDVAVAWDNAKDAGVVHEAGVVYEDVFYADVEASRSALGYGFYL